MATVTGGDRADERPAVLECEGCVEGAEPGQHAVSSHGKAIEGVGRVFGLVHADGASPGQLESGDELALEAGQRGLMVHRVAVLDDHNDAAGRDAVASGRRVAGWQAMRWACWTKH